MHPAQLLPYACRNDSNYGLIIGSGDIPSPLVLNQSLHKRPLKMITEISLVSGGKKTISYHDKVLCCKYCQQSQPHHTNHISKTLLLMSLISPLHPPFLEGLHAAGNFTRGCGKSVSVR